MEFKVGDKVKINKYATIYDLSNNFWNGCKDATLDLISIFSNSNEIFEVKGVHNIDGDVILDKSRGRYINKNLLTLLERPEIKEMTKEEIEKN
jgi:hypothetical protein